MVRQRVVFMGTAELACASLSALAAEPSLLLTAVVTQPDRPKGRNLALQPSAVKRLALKLGVPIFQPERARTEKFIHELQQLEPDLIAVTAYGQILPKPILELPKYGCLNVHTSLLPKYRGAAPIQWAILNGEPETGVTIMKMDEGLDTGDILLQEKTPVLFEDDAESLHTRLGEIGAALLVRAIRAFVDGELKPQPQANEHSSYAPKIKKQDGQLNWVEPASRVHNRVRALRPWPGAFTWLDAVPAPQWLKIWQTEPVNISGEAGRILQADKQGFVVGCGSESLRILEVQREGGRRLKIQEFLAGHPIEVGRKFIQRSTEPG